jgi:hypothetical protein
MAGVGSAALSVKSAPSGSGHTGGNGGNTTGTTRNGPTVNVVVLGVPDFETKRSIAKWVAEVSTEGDS